MRYKGFVKTFKYNGLPIRATVIDAKEPVTIVRAAADVLGGKKADPEQCMDANCVLRHAKSGAFPHPVLAVWVIKSVAYVLRTANVRKGNFIVVRYRHTDWTDIERFDKGQKFVSDKTIVFHVPSASLGADRNRKRNGSAGGSGGMRPPTGRVGKPRGLNARFVSLRQWQENSQIATGRARA